MRQFPLFATLAGTMVLAALTACTSTTSLGAKGTTILGPGVINDPTNRSLRFDILKFGLERFCSEMTDRGIALKLSDEHPVLGRFFADSCQSEVVDEETRKSLLLHFTGRGYAWTNLTGRLGFRVVALVEYSPDFQMAKDRSLYVYFRPRNIQATSYQTTLVESQLAKGAMALSGVDPDQLGRRIFDAELNRGFSVIRSDERGEMTYALGFVPVGVRPFVPFQIVSQKVTLANDRTEVHNNEQDIVGGFQVTSGGQALTITALVDGAPNVDLALISDRSGKQLLDWLVTRPGASPLSEPAMLEDTISYGQIWQRTVPVAPGTYYLLFDQSTAVGRSAPPAAAGDDRAARIDYAVQLGDAP